MSLNRKKFSTEVAERELTLEVSQIAEQANAAVIGKYGETVVLVTAVMGKEDQDIDYMPLVVDYEERFYAVGKILGSRYMRREGKSSDEAVLSGRLIDRTIRPLFNHGIRRDIQLVVTTLSFDNENDLEFVTMITASAALTISDIPWNGPAAGVSVVKINGEFIVNPKRSEVVNKEKVELEVFAAGPQNRINMIEMEARETQETDAEKALEIAQKEINKLIKFQKAMAEEIGKKKTELEMFHPSEEFKNKIAEFLNGKLETAVYAGKKQEMYERLATLRHELMEMLTNEGKQEAELAMANHIFESTIDDLVHENVIRHNKRPDGRKLDEIRPLMAEVGLFERLHGSALFVRGQTQALAVTTLAEPDSAQLIEGMKFQGKKSFMLHYNFPPFSTGEVGRMRGPGRREIGHGALAEKAVRNMIPKKEGFPYAIRMVSEILSSNGSSSMASVCGASLSLMDAGVPIKNHIAGIAMGLMINDKGEYKVLTDIQGPEDHHGDMDFKVAGTKNGITAVQLDVKIHGLTEEIIKETLFQAKKARLEIIKMMTDVIAEPRKQISKYAPKVLTTKINPETIGLLIGPGGKTINGIVEKTGAIGIDVDDDGTVFVFASSQEAAEAAMKQVESVTHEYKVGDIVEGAVVRILEFGAIVEFGPDKDGMIHVSELKDGFVKKVEDVVKVGDFVRAKIIKAEGGKVSLSIKALGKK